MKCKSCGAPLPRRTLTCPHCRSINDIDLRGVTISGDPGPHDDRLCPCCDVRMESLLINVGDGVHIERCGQCMGLFFDPGELDWLLDQSVKHVYEIDHQRLNTLVEQNGLPRNTSVTYVKCPICRDLMVRKSYGPRAGVVMDVCKYHGVWLDGGELRQLQEWIKAGGRMHEEKRKEEQRRREELKSRESTVYDDASWRAAGGGDWGDSDGMFAPGGFGTGSLVGALISTVWWMLD